MFQWPVGLVPHPEGVGQEPGQVQARHVLRTQIYQVTKITLNAMPLFLLTVCSGKIVFLQKC